MSSIQDFYNNQTIFVTGGTGFIGKLIIEKLVRTCPKVKKIFLLVRPKLDKTLDQRFNDIFNYACFDSLKKSNPDFIKKIHLLSGDCSEFQLGLSSEAIEIIKKEVNCIIHSAANTRFDTGLRTAAHTNVRSVRDILNLMKDFENLKSFVYVSTAFSHCYRDVIDEEFYEVDVSPEKLLQMVDVVDEKTLNLMAPHVLGKWPNTYVYTKALAEEVIRSCKQTFPLAIVRPAIVTPTYDEPLPGWIDNMHGIVGIVLGISLGVLRSLHINNNLRAPIVPADHVVNSILAAGWHVAKCKEESESIIPIFNYTGYKKNSINWDYFTSQFKKYTFVYPLSNAVWYRYITSSPYKVVHLIRVFFLHTLFAYFVDLLLFLVGKRPLAVEKYRRINKLMDLLSYFTTRSWNFRNSNLNKLWDNLSEEDKKMFYFDMTNLDWPKYIESCCIGGRVYLMKDPLETLPSAKRKMYMLAVVHYVFVGLMVYFLYSLLLPIFKMFL